MTEPNETKAPVPATFPVVGLGASAGGLEALNAFFEAVPAATGMAFVVVQHLSPNQDSILHNLIQRHTTLNVRRIEDNDIVQPNMVYVLPSGSLLAIEGGCLRLSPMPVSEGWPETINQFFSSLAMDRGENAVAIVLSGAGHDGTDGAAQVKSHGGLVMAQDLETASQSSMPFSLTDAGLADFVLPPELMPGYLLSHFAIDLPQTPEVDDLTGEITDDDLKRISRVVRKQTGYNFVDYKVSTMRRQIARRMGVHQLSLVADYLALLEHQPGESSQLVKGLLIHVTSFFRDANAFEALRAGPLMALLQKLSIDDVFRVWVPGCASGEEAVSIAILIYECLRELNRTEMEVRIFATDLNRELVQRARAGQYTVASTEHISEARLRDHFIRTDECFQVRAHIARMIVWAEHNLIEHPPFSNLYLISCRNVMIYFQPRLQERIRALFQFALRPEGILFLGSSEAMPEASDMFSVLDSKHKIYQRTSSPSQQWMRLDHPLYSRGPAAAEETMTTPKLPQRDSEDEYLRVIREMLLTHYDSTCAIIDERYHMRYAYGQIDQYFRLVAGGEAQQSVLNMAREGLDVELTIALYEAFEGSREIVRRGVQVKTNGEDRLINLIVKPVEGIPAGGRLRLLILEPGSTPGQPVDDAAYQATIEEGATITSLRGEVQQARMALQSATQALQAKSEELTSSMEEIGSANEEIQTTNEELRTSKEELESMNEELNTLNTQLSNQNHELSHANNALYNFLQSTAIGVIFLDQNLAIREYTQAVTAIFSLRKSDVGRPLSEIKAQLTYETLIADASAVLDTLANHERELQTTDGRWYMMEIRPYRTMNNIVDGLVLTFSEITLQKLAQQQAEHTSDYVRQVIDTMESSVLELDSKLHVLAANTAFYAQFQYSPEDTIGRPLYELGSGQWDIPELRRLLGKIIPQRTFVSDYTVTHDFPNLGRYTMRLNARQVKAMNRILLVITDFVEAPVP
ncbi:MAG: PAS domain-containing protein [Pleurocapsa minor GSE-CHR-MK-17-07R]|jgi:two-component system CheB/CheR fusion protein|nr:PAS domain-containing protein [Pleurocapsa minor GSE-CHR-MK 17-07R]